MKNKLVLWVTTGTEETPQRALLAYELRTDENKYEMWMFSEGAVDSDFVNKLMEEWRNGQPLEFPPATRNEVHELTATGELLPADCKTDRPDIVNRAKTEWMFSVLSTKVYSAYRAEVQEFRERSERLTEYNRELWEELKSFWNRVQEQVRFRSIFRDQADTLKGEVNSIFDRLKKLRNEEDAVFERQAKSVYDRLNNTLSAIEQRIQEGKGDLFRVFQELKQLQGEYQNAKLGRAMRNELWERIDAAFKRAKNARYGGVEPAAGANAGGGSGDDRFDKRIYGLRDAMGKMQDSVVRDEKELEDMQARILSGKASQLEVQLREAKVALVQERLKSKQEKLADMQKTHDDLLRKQEKAKADAEKARALQESKAKIEAQKKAEAREKEAEAREKMEKAMAVLESEKKPVEEQPEPDTESTALASEVAEAENPVAAINADAPGALDAEEQNLEAEIQAEAPLDVPPVEDLPEATPEVHEPVAEEPVAEEPVAEEAQAEIEAIVPEEPTEIEEVPVAIAAEDAATPAAPEAETPEA